MRVFVTGATGFVGRWLVDELEHAGHAVVPAPDRSKLDIRDRHGLATHLRASAPDAVVHLAGMSFGPDAARDPATAEDINAGGTQALFDALGQAQASAVVLVTGSADVYGRPAASDLPLREDAPVRPENPYGRSKLRQEETAIAASRRTAIPVVVTRSFNHTGPGQRPVFVAPALAMRLREAKQSGDPRVRVGNVDVRRDFTDVRDVARAYRLLLEGAVRERPSEPLVVNVASGRSTSIGDLLAAIAAAVGVVPELVVDPTLVRPNEPPEIVGDPARIHSLTGWTPEIALDRTVRDLVASLETD